MATKRNPNLHLFIRLDANFEPVPGSDIYRKQIPKDGRWIDLTECARICCVFTTTSTTTTGS